MACIDHEAALKLYHAGASDGKISDELGVSKSSVGRWRKRNDLPIINKAGGRPRGKRKKIGDKPIDKKAVATQTKKLTNTPANKQKNPCCGCVYYSRNSGLAARFCEYILMTGHSRPCKGGAECTVRKEGKRIDCQSQASQWRTFADLSW